MPRPSSILPETAISACISDSSPYRKKGATFGWRFFCGWEVISVKNVPAVDRNSPRGRSPAEKAREGFCSGFGDLGEASAPTRRSAAGGAKPAMAGSGRPSRHPLRFYKKQLVPIINRFFGSDWIVDRELCSLPAVPYRKALFTPIPKMWTCPSYLPSRAEVPLGSPCAGSKGRLPR